MVLVARNVEVISMSVKQSLYIIMIPYNRNNKILRWAHRLKVAEPGVRNFVSQWSLLVSSIWLSENKLAYISLVYKSWFFSWRFSNSKWTSSGVVDHGTGSWTHKMHSSKNALLLSMKKFLALDTVTDVLKIWNCRKLVSMTLKKRKVVRFFHCDTWYFLVSSLVRFFV